ncbi:hypothetical protein GS944_04575 [Rhodococcus hoagii]|nr:hypothetical protein [Prescottella equi]
MLIVSVISRLSFAILIAASPAFDEHGAGISVSSVDSTRITVPSGPIARTACAAIT